MLDDSKLANRKKANKPAVGNGSVALYGRIGRLFCLTFRAGVDVQTLLHGIAGCHELLQDEPLWGPDWIAVGYDNKAFEAAIRRNTKKPAIARQELLEAIFQSIWSGLYTGLFNGQELVTSPIPPSAVPEIDLGVLLHRQAQW